MEQLITDVAVAAMERSYYAKASQCRQFAKDVAAEIEARGADAKKVLPWATVTIRRKLAASSVIGTAKHAITLYEESVG